MLNFNEVLVKSIGIYLVACFGLYKIKHPRMFKPNGEFGDENIVALSPFEKIAGQIKLTWNIYNKY